MGEEQRVAFLMAQTVAAQIELEAMKAANTQREINGFSPAYDEAAFMELITKWKIGHNESILTLIGGQP